MITRWRFDFVSICLALSATKVEGPARGCAHILRLGGGDRIFDAECFGDFDQGVRVMADAECEVVSGAFGAPAFEEAAYVGLEDAVGVGVASRWDGAIGGFTLGDDEFEFAFDGLADAEHGEID
mgnify:CR=1